MPVWNHFVWFVQDYYYQNIIFVSNSGYNSCQLLCFFTLSLFSYLYLMWTKNLSVILLYLGVAMANYSVIDCLNFIKFILEQIAKHSSDETPVDKEVMPKSADIVNIQPQSIIQDVHPIKSNDVENEEGDLDLNLLY